MMLSEKSDNAVPSVSPGSSLSSTPGTVKATPDLMNVSPLLEDTERQMSAGSVSLKDALRKREWLNSRLHQFRVQLQMKKSEQCRAIDSVPVDNLKKLQQKLKDELINRTAVHDAQEQILRGEHLSKTARDILNVDVEGLIDETSVARKRELDSLLNEFTKVSSEVAVEQKDIVRLRTELTELKRKNFELLKKSRQLYQGINEMKKLREEELQALCSDPVGKQLQEKLKHELQENSIWCQVLQGLIAGSGMNWAQDQQLMTLLLETAQPDHL